MILPVIGSERRGRESFLVIEIRAFRVHANRLMCSVNTRCSLTSACAVIPPANSPMSAITLIVCLGISGSFMALSNSSAAALQTWNVAHAISRSHVLFRIGLSHLIAPRWRSGFGVTTTLGSTGTDHAASRGWGGTVGALAVAATMADSEGFMERSGWVFGAHPLIAIGQGPPQLTGVEPPAQGNNPPPIGGGGLRDAYCRAAPAPPPRLCMPTIRPCPLHFLRGRASGQAKCEVDL